VPSRHKPLTENIFYGHQLLQQVFFYIKRTGYKVCFLTFLSPTQNFLFQSISSQTQNAAFVKDYQNFRDSVSLGKGLRKGGG
jgi:hypothetical protein